MILLGFLNPLLLWGLAAASLPIIIHLLNRRRFKRVRWAAMEYLLRAMEENRRRIQLEQLLLLLLRVAIVLLFVFLLARPLTQSGELFGLLRSRVHHIVLLDDSGSMGQRSGNLDLLRAGAREVEDLVVRLRERRADDLVTVIRASRPDKPDFLGERPTTGFSTRLKEYLQPLVPYPDHVALAPLLSSGAARAKETREAAEDVVHLVTDLRRIDWLTDDDQAAIDTLAGLRKFDPARTRFVFHPVGSEDNENVAVLAVRRREGQAVVDVPMTIDVEVQNLGQSPSADAELTLEVDSGTRLTRPLTALEPRQRTTLSFTHTFREAGMHQLRAALPADRFPLDDKRTLALPVRERTRCLIAEGGGGRTAEESGSLYLATALDPGTGEVVSGIGVEVIADHLLKDHDLADVDLLVLSNTGTITEETVGRIEAWVKAGGGLFVFTGDQLEPTTWNNLMFKKGEGLLPCALVGVGGDPDNLRPIAIGAADHETLSKASEAFKVLFPIPQIGRHYTVAMPTDAPVTGAASGAATTAAANAAKVILRIDHEEGPPLVVSKSFGDGKVFLFTVPAGLDRMWSMWPGNPSYLAYMQQAYEFAVRSESLAPWNISPRMTFTRVLNPSQYAPEAVVRWTSSEEEGEDRTFTAVPDETAPNALLLQVNEFNRVGAYRVTLRQRNGTEDKLYVAVNPDPREGQLARATEAGLRRAYPKDHMDRAVFMDKGSGAAELDQGELWKPLVAIVLAFLFLETLLAWRFGRR